MDRLSVRSRKNTSGRSGFQNFCGASTVLKVATKSVCDKCNNDWLSRFENDAIKPIGSPLILGEPVDIIRPADQEKLAAWAYKMALLLEVAMPQGERAPEFFTAAERLDFRQMTFPNEHVRVFPVALIRSRREIALGCSGGSPARWSGR